MQPHTSDTRLLSANADFRWPRPAKLPANLQVVFEMYTVTSVVIPIVFEVHHHVFEMYLRVLRSK